MSNLLGVLAEPLDHRTGRAVVQLDDKPPCLFIDDPFGLGPLPLAFLTIPLAGRLQVIDAVKINVVQFTDRRLHIARHGQIEDQQHAVITLFLHTGEPLARDHRCRR